MGAWWDKFRGLSPNQKITLTLAGASALIGAASLLVSVLAVWIASDSTDMKAAISRLAVLAGEAQKQTKDLQEQSQVMSDQLGEQRQQTASLATQANAAEQQAISLAGDLLVARAQLRQTQYLTAKQAQFESWRQSYTDYRKGLAEFQTVITEVVNALPFDVEERAVVGGLSRKNLDQIRMIVSPVVGAILRYDALVDANMPIWPERFRRTMLAIQEHGDNIAGCFEAAATKALTESEATEVRRRLNLKCRNLGTERQHLAAESHNLDVMMSRQIYGAAKALGMETEFIIPLPSLPTQDSTP